MDRHALVISYHAPQPDRDSGSRRVFHFLQLLQESGWEVVVYAADGAGDAHDVRRLTQQGIPVYDGYVDSIDDVLGDRPFELVLIAYWPNAERYLPRIRSVSPGARVVLDSVDLHFPVRAGRCSASRLPLQGAASLMPTARGSPPN